MGTLRCRWGACAGGDLRARRAGEGGRSESRAVCGPRRRHAAVSYGHVDILEYLLSTECDVNVEDSEGDTPLHFCETQECAELLIASGATLQHKNFAGLEPIQVAAEDGRVDMVRFFRDVYAARGIDVPELPEPDLGDEDEDDEEAEGGDGDGDFGDGDGEDDEDDEEAAY